MDLDFYTFDAGITIGEWIYFSSNSINGLYKRNIFSHKIEFIGIFPEEKINQCSLHKQCLLWKNIIIFIPRLARHIHIFDSNTDKIEMVNVKKIYEEKDCYTEACIVGDVLYMFPSIIEQSALTLNLKTLEISENWSLNEWYKKNIFFPYSCWRILQKEGNIFIIINGSNIIIEYQCAINIFKKIDMPINNIFALFDIGNKIWLVTLDSQYIYELDSAMEIENRYICEGTKSEAGRQINSIICKNGHIFALPALSDDILAFSKEKMKFIKWRDYPKELKIYNNNEMKFYRTDFYKEKILLFPGNSNAIVAIDTVTDSLLLFDANDFDYDKYMRDNTQHLWMYVKDFLCPSDLYTEFDLFKLPVFIKMIEDENSYKLIDKNGVNIAHTIGNLIWNQINH